MSRRPPYPTSPTQAQAAQAPTPASSTSSKPTPRPNTGPPTTSDEDPNAPSTSSSCASSATKQTAACVPCFKRKMRCDRQSPCSNCRRRRDRSEPCHYPVSASNVATVNADLAHRLEKLENYVRATGVDPDMVVRDRDFGVRVAQAERVGRASGANGANGSGMGMGISPVTPSSGGSTPVPRAVDKSSSTWPGRYAWEATVPYRLPSPNGRSETAAEEDVEAPNAFTLFRPNRHIPFLAYEYPSPTIIRTLWRQYITNVHLINRLFFDWQKTPIVEKACEAPSTMTPQEHTFVFSMMFLSVSSLSEERCLDLLSKDYDKAMGDHQHLAEYALWEAGVPTVMALETFQALLMYLWAIRNWGNVPGGTMLSLTAMATRQAERIGLNHDGTEIALLPLETEVRRRVWWQCVVLDLTACLLTGCICRSLHDDWTTKQPGNYEDCDFSPTTTEFPPQRVGITGISDNLLMYRIFDISRGIGPDGKILGMTWAFRNTLSREEKQRRIDEFVVEAQAKFLPFCEPNVPHHVLVSVTIRRFMCGFGYLLTSPMRATMQPNKLDPALRDHTFELALKLLEYHAFAMTADVLKDFIWHTKNGIMWPSLVYALVDVRHRIPGGQLLDRFWRGISQLFEKEYSPFRNLKSALYLATAELILDTWTAHVSEEQEANPPDYIIWLRNNIPSSSVAKRGGGGTQSKKAKRSQPVAPSVAEASNLNGNGTENGLGYGTSVGYEGAAGTAGVDVGVGAGGDGNGVMGQDGSGNGMGGIGVGEKEPSEWAQFAGDDFTSEAFLMDLANTDWSFWDTF